MKNEKTNLKIILRYIVLNVQSGKWIDKLPSIGSLALKFYVSKSYVQTIYDKLKASNYIYSIKNQGYFINNDRIIHRMRYFSFEKQDYTTSPIMNFDSWFLINDVKEKINENINFMTKYKYISKVIENNKLEVYFNHGIKMPENLNTNLFNVFAYNGIAITGQVLFYLNNKRYAFLLDEDNKVQIVVIKKYRDDEIYGLISTIH